jgi:hypothetical protein
VAVVVAEDHPDHLGDGPLAHFVDAAGRYGSFGRKFAPERCRLFFLTDSKSATAVRQQ